MKQQPTLIATRLATPIRTAKYVAQHKTEMDRVCEAIEKGMPVEDALIIGRSRMIINELRKRGIYQPHHETMLNKFITHVKLA